MMEEWSNGERNPIWWIYHSTPGTKIMLTQEEMDRIRVCDKLAKAWEALEKSIDGMAWPWTDDQWEDRKRQGKRELKKEIQSEMDGLLDHPNKDPLKELEEWLTSQRLSIEKCFKERPQYDTDYYRGKLGLLDHILAEIRRLRGKG